MICRSCQRASRTLFSVPRRQFSTTRPLAATPITAASTPTPRQGSPTSSHTPPAATSTSAAQPFSAPLTPAPGAAIEQHAAKVAEKKVAPLVKSSVPAGTPLKGLNFEKNKQDPVALADDEYPAWLWTILQRQETTGDAGAVGDLFCKSMPCKYSAYLLSYLPFSSRGTSIRMPTAKPPSLFFPISLSP